ncbi:MAG: AMP-dependent synthetase, partial [Gammaproteobacteria bacterium]|nr:AMP-dependent synthetase [Gammaproteobacteria bacterium]
MYDVLKKVWTEMTGPGGSFEIEEINVRGFPMRTYKAAPPSLREVWLSSLAFSERPYLVF